MQNYGAAILFVITKPNPKSDKTLKYKIGNLLPSDLPGWRQSENHRKGHKGLAT